MALVLRPRVLIADEPTSALDATTGAHLLALLQQLQAELSLSVLLITHDMHVVELAADRIAVMYAGLIAEIGDRAAVFEQPRHPYTRALIASLDLERERGTLEGVPGAPPGLSQRLDGCPFWPRCPRADDAVPDGRRRPRGQLATRSSRCHHPYVAAGDEADVHAHR